MHGIAAERVARTELPPGGAPGPMRLRVADAFDATALVRVVVLRADGGAALPPARAGAHLRVVLPGDYDDRHYSLVDLPGVADARSYVLGVRLDDHSRGGSRFMHNLTRGDLIRVEGPRQSFPLAEDDRPATLIAGGIGITPLLSMAAALERAGRAYRLHYAGRRRDRLAFVDALERLCGDRLTIHADDDGTRLDIGAALGAADPSGHLYVCGPAGMIEAAREAALARGWEADRIRSELFAAPASDVDAAPFQIELASDGRVLDVPADRSALDVLQAAGLEPDWDCRRGGCGMCRAGVVSGDVDHRDVILSRRERARGDVMQLCVSRAMPRGDGAVPRLVLDL